MGRGAGCGAGAAGFMGAGAAGFAAGAAGFAATTGFGAATTGFAAGFLAAAGFRAGALRAGAFLAAALRAAGLRAAVLRAGAFFLALVFLRALAFLATARPVLRTVRAALRAVLRTVRAVFRAPLRALALLAVRFFPLVFVAMASAPILPYCRTRPLKRTRTARINASTWSRLAVPYGESIVFSYYTQIETQIATESGKPAHSFG